MRSPTELSGLDLPILPFLPGLVATLHRDGILLLSAEPGAGKTSLVPLALAGAAAERGKILLVEPRRVAAVSAAARLCELSGAAPGGEIGYRVRGETRASPSTRIEAVTGGVLLRLLQADPLLEGVGTVVFDEFHERSLDLDLGLALVLESRKARGGPGTPSSLDLLVMSATLDLEALSARLGAPTLAVPGRVFPVETRHAKQEPADPVAWTAEAVLSLLGEVEGDILAFLPGMGEILRAETAIASGLRGAPVELLRLHSSLPLAEQRRAIAPPPGAPRRVVLATSIAETSLTLPRVTAVVDPGLARMTRFDRRSGLNRLVTERESADRAEQRRGRAGRLGPGLCLRGWPAAERLPERTPPEILRDDLSGLVLECLVWGAREAGELSWIDPPPQAAWADGLAALRGLGAATSGDRPEATERGREMAALGAEPRLAALVLRGRDLARGGGGGGDPASTACLAAAALAEPDPGREIDFAQRLASLVSGRDPASSRVAEEAGRLAARAGLGFAAGRAEPALLPSLLAAAWPDRIARRLEGSAAQAVFAIPAGRRIRVLPPLSASPWILALDAEAGESLGRLYSGLALPEAAALEALAPLAGDFLAVEWRGRSYRARRERRAGSLELSSTAAGALEGSELAKALAERLAREGFGALLPDEGAEAFLARYAYFRGLPGGEGLPELSAAGLGARGFDWLSPWIESDPAEILPGDRLQRALESLLPAGVLRALREAAPERILLPSGISKRILYGEGPRPLVEGRVQEFYGLASHPGIGGRPLVLRLLSPAGRPVQVTSDLPGFWKGAWAEVRKELRGRYPKHDWPEDPSKAQPSAKGLKPRPPR